MEHNADLEHNAEFEQFIDLLAELILEYGETVLSKIDDLN